MVLKCPSGMVLIDKGGPIYPDEKPFCIMKTEVTQEEDKIFWAAELKTKWELLIKTTGAPERRITVRITRSDEKLIRAEAAQAIKESGIYSVEVHPVLPKDRLKQPSDTLAGPRKPAMFRKWDDARRYCMTVYKGGDLPTGPQWEKACGAYGERKYCTVSGLESNLKHEADYGRSIEDGPYDVDAFLPNPNGIFGMSGGVWEWILAEEQGMKIFRGGSWIDSIDDMLPTVWSKQHPEIAGFGIGYRCVAPTQDI